jgi:predicted dehydrogenase
MALSVAFPTIARTGARAAAGRPGPNDRIRVALIGSGHRARDLLLESPAELELVSVADCDLRQIDGYLNWLGETRPEIVVSQPKRYQDYRRMLEEVQLDAVFVATTTHARISICVHAMQAGLDVYAEKPLTLTIEEGRHLVRAEQKYGTVLQVGSQQRSIPINNFGSDLVRGGAIGKVHTVLCPNFIGPERRAEVSGEPVPSGMNWDMWCHQTPLVPYSPSLHPGLGKWGRWRAYDGGGLGWGVTGWGTHALDQVQRALGTDDTGPVEIRLEEKPSPTAKVSLQYASGTVLKLALPKGTGPGLGAIFVGGQGKIEINRNRVASNPAELVANAPEPDDKSEYASVAQRHIQDWVDCIRSRSKPVGNAEVGHRATTLCHLINICREVGRDLKWDPVREEFVGDDAANLLRTRPRRKGYELPELT